MASAVLDASVSPEMLPISEIAPSTPVGPTMAPELTVSPVENIPVVIITDSTDGDPDSSEEIKSLVSGGSEEARSTMSAISMQVMNRVSSPSKHRYYGQEVVTDAESETVGGTDRPILLLDTSDKAEETHGKRRRSSLSVSLSPSRSITRSSHTGMDEFLLISPTSSRARSHSVRSVLGRSPRLSVSTGDGTGTVADIRLSVSTYGEEPVPVFRAFPCLSPGSAVRPTRIGAVGFVLAAALVLTALVYDIVETAEGS